MQSVSVQQMRMANAPSQRARCEALGRVAPWLLSLALSPLRSPQPLRRMTLLRLMRTRLLSRPLLRKLLFVLPLLCLMISARPAWAKSRLSASAPYRVGQSCSWPLARAARFLNRWSMRTSLYQVRLPRSKRSLRHAQRRRWKKTSWCQAAFPRLANRLRASRLVFLRT